MISREMRILYPLPLWVRNLRLAGTQLFQPRVDGDNRIIIEADLPRKQVHSRRLRLIAAIGTDPINNIDIWKYHAGIN